MDGGSTEQVEAPATPAISLQELEAQITALAGQLNAANYRWLTLIAEFDRRLGWADGKLPSCAHWLNFKCGLNLGAAREKVRVAHSLADLPRIAASMGRGELSYSKVRALTRVACPATEQTLLMIALHGTAYHVERLVRGYRRARQAAEISREAHQHAGRSVNYYYADDGSLILKCRLPALTGAMLVKALDAAMEIVPASAISADVAAERAISYEARRADAMAAIAESFLAAPAISSNAADRYQVVVHVDAETLQRPDAGGSEAGRCEIENGPSIPAETARRLSCDSSLSRVVEDAEGGPLDVGRKTRSIPPAIRRALNNRDGGCRFPGCTHQRYVDAHHVEHWAHGGETKLSNLVTLCRLHHRLVHEGEVIVEALAGGGWRFLHPDGRHFEIMHCTRFDQDECEDFPVKTDAAATRWRGEPMDYDLGVWVLCNQARSRDVALNVSAETSYSDYDALARRELIRSA